MTRKRPSGYSGAMQRCAACSGHYEGREIRQVRRVRAPGVLYLCNSCWHAMQVEVKRGKGNLGALLEEIAARVRN